MIYNYVVGLPLLNPDNLETLDFSYDFPESKFKEKHLEEAIRVAIRTSEAFQYLKTATPPKVSVYRVETSIIDMQVYEVGYAINGRYHKKGTRIK